MSNLTIHVNTNTKKWHVNLAIYSVSMQPEFLWHTKPDPREMKHLTPTLLLDETLVLLVGFVPVAVLLLWSQLL